MAAEDIFDKTVETYCSLSGAAAYVGKEIRHVAGRSETAAAAMQGLALEGLRVLDVGCGFGRDVAEFRRRGAVAFGCDISEALLHKARSDHGEGFAHYDVRGGEPLPFHGGFDVVWFYAVLVHVPREEMPAVMERLWEGIKPGGLLVLGFKPGVGQRVVDNLGHDLERVMVYYPPEEVLAVLQGWGGAEEARGNSALATGDAFMWLRVRKG